MVYTVPRAPKAQAVADVSAAAADGAAPSRSDETRDCLCTAFRSTEPPSRTRRWKAEQSAKCSSM
jgi:hypothetical protein